MKRIFILSLFILIIGKAFSQDCYLVVEKPGKYNAKTINGIVIPMLGQQDIKVKMVPAFGVKNTDCQYVLNLLEDKLKTTVTISGREVNIVGESTLAGLIGIQQAVLRGMVAASPNLKKKFCEGYSQIIPQLCGIDLASKPSEEENEIWEIIKDTEAPEDIIDFIHTFPNGRYRYLANHKLMLLGQPPVEIDRAKNGNSIQEKELWDQIKPRLNLKELEYFLQEFPNGKKKSVAKLLIKKLKRDQKKKELDHLFWTTEIDKPLFNGLYYSQGQAHFAKANENIICYTYYRFFPDGSVLSWFNRDLGCGTGKQADDEWTLNMVGSKLCKLPGCREELYYKEVALRYIIELDEDEWFINDKKQLVIVSSSKRIKDGRFLPAQKKEFVIGPLFKPGIRSIHNDTRLEYNDPKKWELLFIPYENLKIAKKDCQYESLLENGKNRLASYISDKSNKSYTDYKTAVAWFKSAIQCDSDRKEAFFALANAYEIKNKPWDASATYLELLSAYRDDIEAILKVTELFHNHGKHEWAMNYLIQFEQENGISNNALKMADLKALMYNCNCEKVIEKGQEMLESQIEDPLINHYLGICYVYEKNAEKSIFHFTKRTNLDGEKYTQKGLSEQVSIHYRLKQNAAFKNWFNNLEKGQSTQTRYYRSCLRKSH